MTELGSNACRTGRWSDITIVITSYNHDMYLPDAIKSACSQTYPPKDIIILDDGSTDDTRSIVDTYKEVVYCLLYTSPSPRDRQKSRMPSSA